MPTQPATPPPGPELPPSPSEPAADASPPDPDPASPAPARGGAIFRALVDAGAEAMVAYTAEQRIHAMVLEAVPPQLQPLVVEMRRRFEDVYRRFADVYRRLDVVEHRLDAVEHRLGAVERRLGAVERRLDAVDRKLDDLARRQIEQDRKLDVVVARLDGMRLVGQVIFGALALLATALIAVLGILLTS